MTEDHWKPNLLLALLWFVFLSGTLLKECHGQANSNYFYYYTPTQRTMVNHGLASGGQIFSNPFFTQHYNQQQQVPQQQSQQTASHQPQQQQAPQQPSLPLPTVPPSFQQQTTLLGFNHPHFQNQQQQTTLGSVFPSAHLQFPLAAPTPAQPSHPQQQQQQLPQQSPPAYNTFTRFGHNSLLGQQQQFPQPSQPSYFSTQSPLGTVAPGTFNFFQNPFQYLQNQFVQPQQNDVQPTPPPVATPLPTPTTTATPPPPPPPSPTPTSSEMVDSPGMEQVIERRQKFSSRFRYVQQPPQPQIRQYNPYSHFGSPYTSDLPYTEQRFYSSPTTPTGYAYSLGGENGNGATSTVHFSMGPSSNIQQYLKEITATRSMLHRQRIEQSTPPVQEVAAPVLPSEMIMSHDAPSTPEPIISTTMTPQTPPTPAPQTPEPMPTIDASPASASEATNATLEPLLNEPSFQSETSIAAPAAPIDTQVAQKISETNIPTRLVIRKKVARKRLRLDGSGEVVQNGAQAMPVGVMIRRIASPNRLPVDQPKRFEDETPKGPTANAALEVAAVTPSTTTTTTTTESIVPEQVEMHPDMEHADDVEPQHMEPQPTSTTTAQPQPMEAMVEAHMPMDQEGEKDNVSSGNLMQDQQNVPLTMPEMPHEEIPAMMNKETDDVQQQPMEMLSTTPAPIQPPPVESMIPENPAQPISVPVQSEQSSKHEDDEEYYVDDYADEAPIETHSLIMQKPESPSRVMTADMANPSDSGEEVPVLTGLHKEDFPGVFHPSDNSVETDQGQLITRVTSSHPSASAEVGGEIVESPVSSTPGSTTTTTTEEIPSVFMKEDPVEEQPPMDSEEPAIPVFQSTTTTTTTPEAVPMMTTTPSAMMMSSSVAPSNSVEHSSDEITSAENHDDDPEPFPMPPQVNQMELSSSTESEASSTEAPEGHMAQMNDEARVLEAMSEQSVSSTTEYSNLMPEIEMSAPFSTESVQSEEVISGSSTTTMVPPSATTEALSSMEQSMDDDIPLNSQEASSENLENQPNSQEDISDSEEIGKAQRLALQETLRRLRERQQSSSTSEPQDQLDSSEASGRKMFMRRPLELANLPLPTTRPLPKINAVLDEEEGVDRSQVIQKIQRFRANFRTTTTKRPRRVTRPSPGTERRLAVVVPVEDLLERQQQVDSFSDSSSTPGTAVEQATTTPTPTYYRSRTTPSTTTTVIPEESSTTPSTMEIEDEMNYPSYTAPSSTETYSTTTTLPPMLTRKTDEASSTTESMVIFGDEVSSTTETDFEQVTTRMEQEMTATTTARMTSAATTETEMMTTTTTPVSRMARTTTPSTTTYATTMTDFSSDDKYDMNKMDDDVFYEENNDSAQNVPISSSTETSTEDDLESILSSTSTTTTTPPSSTDPINAYLTTTEPISGSATTDISTTPVGELIIHEILPTMPPLKEVSFVIGESVEDDQSSAVDASSSASSESDELLAADKAVVRVEAKVHVSTNTTTDIGGASVEQSLTSQELTRPLISTSGESGEGGRRRVRVVIKKQRRLRRPEGATPNNGEGRRRRRKVLHRRRPL